MGEIAQLRTLKPGPGDSVWSGRGRLRKVTGDREAAVEAAAVGVAVLVDHGYERGPGSESLSEIFCAVEGEKTCFGCGLAGGWVLFQMVA